MATTEKVAACPTVTVALVGCCVIAGAVGTGVDGVPVLPQPDNMATLTSASSTIKNGHFTLFNEKHSAEQISGPENRRESSYRARAMLSGLRKR